MEKDCERDMGLPNTDRGVSETNARGKGHAWIGSSKYIKKASGDMLQKLTGKRQHRRNSCDYLNIHEYPNIREKKMRLHLTDT